MCYTQEYFLSFFPVLEIISVLIFAIYIYILYLQKFIFLHYILWYIISKDIIQANVWIQLSDIIQAIQWLTAINYCHATIFSKLH